MSSVDIENRILDAIDTIVKDRVDNAGYDKTIRGIVSKLEDTITGKYLVRYQDSIIEAYSNNLDIRYPEGTLVDILVPNGDFSATKIILNAINKNKVEYNSTTTEESKIEIVGSNAITATQEFGLCSYHENDIIRLYSRDDDINIINYDKITFEEYAKENNKILYGAKFRTDFDAKQGRNGDFGIVYEIDFKNNTTGDIITRTFTINVNKMVGLPYSQHNPTRQYIISKIENENFVSVKNIYIYSTGFSIIDETKDRKDIFVQDIELYSVRDLTNQELTSYSLSLTKNGKSYFDETSQDKDVINIQATLKLKGNILTTQAQYYWFINNNEITEESPNYVKYGGIGWECINLSSKVDDSTNLWVTDDNYYNIKREQCVGEKTTIKCVAVKNDIIIAENEIPIYIHNSEYTVEITSNQGTQFYFDNGNPTLTCLVNKKENNDYTYYWTCEDINKEIQILNETAEDNEKYNAAKDEYETLLAKIETGSAGAAASAERLTELKEIIDSYDYQQRVEKNKIICVDLSKIVEQTTFRCTVKDEVENQIIGSADIIIYNTLGLEGEYKLNILNGVQTFNYNYNGIAPTNKTLEKPIQLDPLAFEIVDPKGKRFDTHILKTCDISWTIPKIETLLTGEDSSKLTLTYGLADKFDYKKLNNNNIKLNVKYKNLNLEAQTSFTFVKDGDPGTNATGVICRIVPNIEDENSIDYVSIVNGELNYTPLVANKWFRTQLWENGEKIFDDYKSDDAHIIKWSILNNTYTRSGDGAIIHEPETITIDENDNFNYQGYNSDGTNIIKVQVDYKDTTYYCTYPIIISEVEENYKINLKENSGFRFVIYASDGKQPQYDNTTPFTIQTKQFINGYWEDITDNMTETLSYIWTVKGSVYDYHEGGAFVNNINLKINEDIDLPGNQKFLIPNEDFTGECINNGIEIKILNSYLEEIGKIFIPIHMYLDRYGIAALNGWDGNTIQINDSGDCILAPQIGAGIKNNDNTFTGILMGSVKERVADSESSGTGMTKVGLLGFNSGNRTIWLDANTGKAEFGTEKSKIIIDPSKGAKIYGGGYERDPSKGMLIDLEKPEIKWGNGNFSVDENGIVKCTNGIIQGEISATKGIIGGYDIDGSILKGKNGLVGMCSESGPAWAFWAGGWPSGEAPFHVGHDGTLYCSQLNVTGGSISATNISGGTIDGTRISGSNIHGGYIYGGTIDGGSITIGANDQFKVTTGGKLTAKSGTIAGWKIKTNGFSSESERFYMTETHLSADAGTYTVIATWSSIAEAGNQYSRSNSSDIRLKNNINILEAKDDFFFDNLKPISFTFKEDSKAKDGNKKHFGFIAQDIIENTKKIKENNLAIIGTDAENYYTVDKAEIIALNTWQIQKLKKQVADLTQQIQELKEGKINEVK